MGWRTYAFYVMSRSACLVTIHLLCHASTVRPRADAFLPTKPLTEPHAPCRWAPLLFYVASYAFFEKRSRDTPGSNFHLHHLYIGWLLATWVRPRRALNVAGYHAEKNAPPARAL